MYNLSKIKMHFFSFNKCNHSTFSHWDGFHCAKAKEETLDWVCLITGFLREETNTDVYPITFFFLPYFSSRLNFSLISLSRTAQNNKNVLFGILRIIFFSFWLRTKQVPGAKS